MRARRLHLLAEVWGKLAMGMGLACAAPPSRGMSIAQAAAAGPFDAIVVLGNRPPQLPNGTVNPELISRLRHGVALFNRKVAPKLLLTGGASGEAPAEAHVMADIAEELGVSRQSLLIEDRSQNTIENARLSARLLCGAKACSARVLLATNSHHGPRAVRLFRCAGLRAELSASEPSKGRRSQARFVEQWAGFYYWFFDECARAKQ